MKAAVVLGTRPEIVKMSPIVRELQRRQLDFFILHTGQHYSYEMDSVGYVGLHQKSRMVTANENLDLVQLIALSREGYKAFYLRTPYILRRLWKTCRSVKEFKVNFQGLMLLIETLSKENEVA